MWIIVCVQLHIRLETVDHVMRHDTLASCLVTSVTVNSCTTIHQYALGPHEPLVKATPGGSSAPLHHGTPSAMALRWRCRKAGRIGPAFERMLTSGASGSCDGRNRRASPEGSRKDLGRTRKESDVRSEAARREAEVAGDRGRSRQIARRRPQNVRSGQGCESA